MTENEAIKVLKQPCNCNYDLSATVENCDISKCDKREATKMAIKALEKQMPKKPEIRNATCADIESELRDFITTQGEICRCPTCKDTICVSGIEYCWYCGQRLDWSEESEE